MNQRGMDMADKIEREFGRDEFADYLATIAEQLRAGKLSSEKGTWTVPERFGAKMQLKEKKGRISLKLNWSWSTLADYSQQDRKQINDWHESMKTVKKRMGSSFREVVKASEKGVFPEKKALEDFVATSRVFAESADQEWSLAMDEYMDHLENFIRAVEEQQLELMLHEIRDLQYRMRACHKEFK
jgi:XXXCH domain-containing protein